MADVDTSSYPKPAALPVQKSVMDQIKGYGELEQQKLSIDAAKLKQINDQFGLMNAELSTLANDPSITKDVATKRLQTLSTTFGLKPEITKHMMDELNAAPNVKSFAQNALVRGMQTQEKVNNLYGSPQIYSQGQQDTPVNVSPMRGMVPMGAPIQRQIPPTAGTVDENNQPRMQGPMLPVAPAGVATGPGQRPVAPALPVARPGANLTAPGNTITGMTAEDAPITPNQVVTQRFPAPSGPAVGVTPMFEEGRKVYAQDQQNSAAKMLAAKPAIQALPLMLTPGFLSGPITDQFTKVVAGLKSTGLINIADNADPTAIRQEVAKKLNAYVSSSPVGQRSDAAQTLKEASSPSPNVQILPALVKLTKDAIALDRVEAAMPNAFKGKDYDNYIKHKGTFPQSVDEKAFTLDLEPPEKSAQMVDEMAKKLQSKNARDKSAAEKFFKSLRMAKEQGFYQ